MNCTCPTFLYGEGYLEAGITAKGNGPPVFLPSILQHMYNSSSNQAHQQHGLVCRKRLFHILVTWSVVSMVVPIERKLNGEQ